MAYNEFAYFYDSLNEDADYDALYRHIKTELENHGIQSGILADLGCGTGELTLMLAQDGYDMIAIDQSEEMLCVVRDKADQLELTGRLLLLEQDLCHLDLTAPFRGRCPPLTPSTTCPLWMQPLPMRAFSWKRAACCCLI